MRKRYIFIVLLCLILTISCALVACKKDEKPAEQPAAHIHTYSEDWTYDDDYHWHAATCEHKTLTSGKAQHTPGSNGKCTVCQATVFVLESGFQVYPFKGEINTQVGGNETMTMPSLPTDIENSLVIHYWREKEEDYPSWGFWMWSDDAGMAGICHMLQYQDEFGAVYVLPDVAADKEYGIIPIACPESEGATEWGSSWTKDVDADRKFIPADYTQEGTNYHVYLVQGDSNVYANGTDINYGREGAFTALDHIDMTFASPVTKVVIYEGDEVLHEGEIQQSAHVGYVLEHEVDFSKNYTAKVTFVIGDKEQTMNIDIKALFGTDQFGEQFNYDGDDLGAVWTQNSTTFKVWSPVSTRIVLKLYNSGDGGEAYETQEMTMGEKGVWSYTANGNLEGKYYTYTVYNSSYNGKEIVDPYAKSAGLSGKRGMIVNFDSDSAKPDGWDSFEPHKIDPNELVVWETHVADVTSNASWNGPENLAKTFLGMIQPGTKFTQGTTTVKTGFDHIVELGVNAVQLVPIFDQANDESQQVFNWGYNPLNYNVLEGSYSSNARDGYARIKEFRQLVQAFGGENINIIMDVVFNHVSTAPGSNFDVLMPGYYFRYTSSGALSSGSGCGNDTASEHYMFRKFMIDSVCFWAETYKLGGFRFDLMGLHDLDTMNELVAKLQQINPDIIVYGEPWSLSTSTTVKLATQDNANDYAKGLAQFNDQMRDALIKGGLSGATELGWASDGEVSISLIVNGMQGFTGSRVKDLYKTVNYVTCHDNYTLKDRMVATGKIAAEDAKGHAMVANSVVLTSNGISFMLAGEEFLRSKGDLATKDPMDTKDEAVHNSYSSSYQMNSLDYSLKITNAGMFENYKALIAFKKMFVSEFGLDSNEAVTAHYKVDAMGEKNGVIVVTITAKDGTEWKIAHANGNGAGTVVDFGGYTTLYLNTLGGEVTLNANTEIAAYQTIIAHK